MSQQSKPPAAPVIPEQKFWERYSPNQEFPISGLTSAALHVAAVIALVLVFNLVLGSRDTGMAIESILLGGDPNAGGGGDPSAASETDRPGQPRVERANKDELPPNMTPANITMGAIPEVGHELPDLPENPDSNRIFDQSKDAKSKLDDVAKTPPKHVPPQGPGRGGPGSGGGSGPGAGPGTGGGNQPGTQGSIRARRNKRWTLTFDAQGGEYLRQLSILGAILVGDYADGNLVAYRKLDRKPVPAEPMDAEIRQRIGWIDERSGAIRELVEAMGLTRPPMAMRAYFPFKLENELLSLELAFRGKKEEEIHSTIFRVVVDKGGYKLVVTDQRYH